MLPGTGSPFWALGLIVSAVQECTAVFLGAALALGILALLAVPLSRSPRTGPVLLLYGAAWGSAAWILRDRLFLLADSMIDFQMVELSGEILIDERAPLTARLMEAVARSLSGMAGPSTVFAAVSVLSGFLVALVLWRFSGSSRGRPGPAPFLVLVFGSPLGFVFFGHVETYPLYLAGFALVVAMIARSLDRGRVGPLELGLLVALCFMHYMSVLLFLPVVSVMMARRTERARVFPVFGGLLLAGMAGLAAVEPLRRYTLFGYAWSGNAVADYAWDVLNGWFLLIVPLGFLVLVHRRRVLRSEAGRFLLLVVVIFALFPLIARFDLGMYRDLDLMAPAFIALCLLAGRGLAGTDPGRGFAAAALGGVVLLAAFQVHQVCPAGAREMERHLDREAMEEGARRIGTEVLAYHYRRQGELEESARVLEKAIAALPGNARLYGPLGEVQLALGDTATAIESLIRSMDSWRAPRTAPLLVELLTLRGDPDAAVRVLRPHRAVLVEDSRAAAALAVAYYRAGFAESTLAVARERLEIAPDDPVARVNAASALTALGEPDGALAEMERAVALDPETLEYQRRLLALIARVRGEAAARAYLESLRPSLREAILSGS